MLTAKQQRTKHQENKKKEENYEKNRKITKKNIYIRNKRKRKRKNIEDIHKNTHQWYSVYIL